MHAQGPKRGRKCYVTPAFSGIPNAKRGDKIRSGSHPCILWNPKKGGIATQSLHSRGSQTPSSGRKSKMATSPLPSHKPKGGRNCYVTPAFSGIPNAKRGNIIRSGYLSPAFSEAQKRAELLRNPCILGDPQCQARGQKSEVASSPLPSRGPKRGRNCHVAPAFTGIPNAKRGEKFRSGYLTLAFSGAQKRAELLRNPCILGDPQRQARGQNQKWLPHPHRIETALWHCRHLWGAEPGGGGGGTSCCTIGSKAREGASTS